MFENSEFGYRGLVFQYCALRPCICLWQWNAHENIIMIACVHSYKKCRPQRDFKWSIFCDIHFRLTTLAENLAHGICNLVIFFMDVKLMIGYWNWAHCVLDLHPGRHVMQSLRAMYDSAMQHSHIRNLTSSVIGNWIIFVHTRKMKSINETPGNMVDAQQRQCDRMCTQMICEYDVFMPSKFSMWSLETCAWNLQLNLVHISNACLWKSIPYF